MNICVCVGMRQSWQKLKLLHNKQRKLSKGPTKAMRSAAAAAKVWPTHTRKLRARWPGGHSSGGIAMHCILTTRRWLLSRRSGFAVKLLFHKARIIETILYSHTGLHTYTHSCACHVKLCFSSIIFYATQLQLRQLRQYKI